MSSQSSPSDPLLRRPRSTLEYYIQAHDPDVTCPICYDPVIPDAVLFSCHPHLPHCSDCVAVWLVQQLYGPYHMARCPCCRNEVSLADFDADWGRWEDVVRFEPVVSDEVDVEDDYADPEGVDEADVDVDVIVSTDSPQHDSREGEFLHELFGDVEDIEDDSDHEAPDDDKYEADIESGSFDSSDSDDSDSDYD